MRLLVTGGAGYIGSHTVGILLNAGHEVCVFDNFSTGYRDAIPEAASLVQGDIRSLKQIEQALTEYSPDAVIHFAGKISVAESFERPIEYFETNTAGTLNLLAAMQTARCGMLIFSSTAAVYGDVLKSPVFESHPLVPINPYGHSKEMAERIIRLAEKSAGIKYGILRYFNVAGASINSNNGQRSKKATQLIHVATEAALGLRLSLEVFGTDYETADGTCIRDFIHVEDLARAHLDTLEYLAVGGHSTCFNVGYGRGYSVRNVIETMKAVSGVDFPVRAVGRRPGDPAQVIAETTEIMQKTRWRPRYVDLSLICKSSLDWMKKKTQSQAVAEG